MSWLRDDISRDGFTSAYGRFCTARGRIERVDGTSLRRMFLPKLTPDAQKTLREHSNFVYGQLQHYGVSFDEKKLTGNGTLLMKQVLQAGKCDAVPAHILALQEQLHREWLETQTIEDLATHPDWLMDKYFLRGVDPDRQPDRTKTTTVIGVPFPLSSEYRAGSLRNAADKVAGLYHETGRGPKTQTIFLGWDRAAIKAAVAGHAAKEKKDCEKEKKELQAQEKKRTAERTKLHKDYLKTLKKGSRKAKPSPAGSYIVDCEDIENNWPDSAEDLALDIHDTDEPGVFQACFDFGVLEGVMVIGTDEAMLQQYCSRADRNGYRGYLGEGDWDNDDDDDDDDEEEEEEEEEEEDDRLKAGSKRKAPHNRGPTKTGLKKAKPGRPRSTLTYRLKSRSRETGESQIHPRPEDGTLKFKDASLTAFVGEAGFPCVGSKVSFTARKISDMPCSQKEEWAAYSEEEYERARVARWH